jgi:hypothetical protein
MFCDMVGSSALSTRLDPEEQRDVVSAFQTCCANEIKRLGGMVAQYLGDGVLAYFGYPIAHEDDAERAVRAGLAIIDSVGRLKTACHVTLEARIGIASGVVVVGDLVREGLTQENAAIGETTNLAARLQALAETGTRARPRTRRPFAKARSRRRPCAKPTACDVREDLEGHRGILAIGDCRKWRFEDSRRPCPPPAREARDFATIWCQV